MEYRVLPRVDVKHLHVVLLYDYYLGHYGTLSEMRALRLLAFSGNIVIVVCFHVLTPSTFYLYGLTQQIPKYTKGPEKKIKPRVVLD